MEIQFLSSISDSRTVTKNFTTLATTQAEPFGAFDITTPILRVKPFPNFANANYFYIPEYFRYYSVQKVVRISGNIIEVYGVIDVLSTYDNVIRQSRGVCIANQNVGSGYIVDKNYPLEIRKKTEVYELEGDPFNTETATDSSYNFVLNVAGGSYAEPDPPESEV